MTRFDLIPKIEAHISLSLQFFFSFHICIISQRTIIHF